MGNSFGGRKTAKVMKLDGETLKFKLPLRVLDVIKDHPDHVLMESDAVRELGIRAKPMEDYRELKPKRLYFLVVLPKTVATARGNEDRAPRRAHSGIINMSARERLESLMLSRRSVSDLTLVKGTSQGDGEGTGGVRVRMRLPKAEVAKVVEESKDAREAAERIMALCAARSGEGAPPVQRPERRVLSESERCKPRQKGVRFLPVQEGELV